MPAARRRRLLGVALFVSSALSSISPLAQEARRASTTYDLTARVTSGQCRIFVGRVSFGRVEATAPDVPGLPVRREVAVRVVCPREVEYAVAMGAGQNDVGQFRRLADDARARFLSYQIFTSRNKLWAGQTVVRGSGVGVHTGTIQLEPVARDAGGQPVADDPGRFADTVTARVEF